MNWKRYTLASLAVFVAVAAMETLINGVLLKADYEQTIKVWRPDMQSKMWILWVATFITSFIFTLIFVKGREGKGIMEGVRFGFLIGLYTSLPMACGTYAMLDIPLALARKWFLFGTLEAMIMGIIVAAIYRPKTA